jgi:hypothetical protein
MARKKIPKPGSKHKKICIRAMAIILKMHCFLNNTAHLISECGLCSSLGRGVTGLTDTKLSHIATGSFLRADVGVTRFSQLKKMKMQMDGRSPVGKQVQQNQ